MLSEDKLFITIIFAFAPAYSKAFTLSYSQFVPGKTGIITFGFAILIFETILFFVS